MVLTAKDVRKTFTSERMNDVCRVIAILLDLEVSSVITEVSVSANQVLMVKGVTNVQLIFMILRNKVVDPVVAILLAALTIVQPVITLQESVDVRTM